MAVELIAVVYSLEPMVNITHISSRPMTFSKKPAEVINYTWIVRL